ncbi:MAG: hypothetical protein M3O62_19865 [Pseudomonadota bacterium]|nr:hypothetical protein [Pseudomonadota bacterium]
MNRHQITAALSGLLLSIVSFAAIAADLKGTWRGTVNGEAAVLELRGEGKGAFNGAALSWQVQLGMLFLESDGEVQAYSFSVDGNRMTVAGGDLAGPVTLERGKAAVAGAGAAAAKPQAAPSSATGVRPELAGKWCYLGSFSANMGGGSQSEKCFELRANGTYSYHSESSSSAYSSGNSGLWGGTSSSSDDQGRWSATADSLTAQSSNGGTVTYPLQLRNHPKNRDPMICLDGECYVTHWQKAPW